MTITSKNDSQYLLWPNSANSRLWYRNRNLTICSLPAEKAQPRPYWMIECATWCDYIGPGIPGNRPKPAYDAPNEQMIGYLYYENSSPSNSVYRNCHDLAWNKARSRFVNAVFEGMQAQLGATAAEAREGLSTIENRVLQLGRLVRAVKRRDFHGFWANLSSKESVKRSGLWDSQAWQAHFKKGRHVVKTKQRLKNIFSDSTLSAAEVWMESWFFWVPTWADVMSGLEVLTSSSPPFGQRIEVTGSSRLNNIRYAQSYGYKTLERYSQKYRIGARVRVTNPNVFLANQLGLLDVPGMLWEVTRLSFLIDWVVNVGEFLSGFTDTWGWEFVPNTGYKCRTSVAKGTWTYRPTDSKFWADYRYYGRVFQRTPLASLPGPTLVVTKLDGLSTTRALTALSLLRAKLDSLH